MAVTTKKKSGSGTTTTVKTKAPTTPSKAASPTVAPSGPVYTPAPKPAAAPKAAQQNMSRNPHQGATPAAPAQPDLPVWNQYNPSTTGTRTKAGAIPEPDRTSRPTETPAPVYPATNALGSGGGGIPVWNQYTQGVEAPPFNMMTRGVTLPVWNQYAQYLPNATSRGVDTYVGPWTEQAREEWRAGERQWSADAAQREAERTQRRRAVGRSSSIDIVYPTAPAPLVDPSGGLTYPEGYDTNGDGYADYWPPYMQADDGWGGSGRGGWGGSGWNDWGDDYSPVAQDWFVGMQNWRF